MTEPGSHVELVAVTRRFGPVIAVDGVSLAIRAGEFFTLLGPSGSGKTTLLHLLAGFQEPDEGEVRLDGDVVSGLPPFKRDIGVVFQSYALFPHMNVFENVAFPLRVRGIGGSELRQRVASALDLVQLGGLDERKPAQLSGGQQQRVALARALVFEPRLLLMDEPLSALDAKLRRSMREEIKTLQRKLAVTVIYVTHDQDEALAMSDRVAVMNKGRVEQIDTPDMLYEKPANRFVADFLGEANLIEATVVAQDDLLVTETAVGEHRLRARARERLEVGASIAIAVRPERITISPEVTCDNTLAGHIESSAYGGDHTLVRVDIGDAVISLKLPIGGPAQPAAGDRIRIGWPLECATALAR